MKQVQRRRMVLRFLKTTLFKLSTFFFLLFKSNLFTSCPQTWDIVCSFSIFLFWHVCAVSGCVAPFLAGPIQTFFCLVADHAGMIKSSNYFEMMQHKWGAVLSKSVREERTLNYMPFFFFLLVLIDQVKSETWWCG